MSATQTQQTDLKALAEAVLQRNHPGNRGATQGGLRVAPPTERNGATPALEAVAAEACLGLSGSLTPEALLNRLAPEDLAELNSFPDPLPFLRSFAIALVWSEFRQQGMAPPGWDQPARCDRCGPVLLWAPLHVAGCPWCFNRRQGIRIPRPNGL